MVLYVFLNIDSFWANSIHFKGEWYIIVNSYWEKFGDTKNIVGLYSKKVKNQQQELKPANTTNSRIVIVIVFTIIFQIKRK